MSRPRVSLPEYPSDWNDATSPYHGFSKYSARRCYRPVLYLNGIQHCFGHCTSRLQAAEMHDMLLRFFVAFTSPRTKPNFPATFFDLAVDSVLGLDGEPGGYPHRTLIALEDKLTAEFGVMQRNVDEYRTKRHDDIKLFRDSPDPEIQTLEKNRKRAFERLEKFSLDLTQFPLNQSYVELNVTGAEGSLLVKDAGLAFLEANQKLRDAKDAILNLIEAVKATI